MIEDQNAVVRSESGSGVRHSLGLGRKDPFDNLFPSGIPRGVFGVWTWKSYQTAPDRSDDSQCIWALPRAQLHRVRH